MKHRITYLLSNPESFNPDLLEVADLSLSLRKLEAAKEHRLTFGLNELPSELRKAFEQLHELHIRWASEAPYAAVPPFTSRVTPGLHVFYTPQKDQSDAILCPLLKDAFGDELKCLDPKQSFTKLPILSERFSMSSSSQYFSYVPSLAGLSTFIREQICPPSSTTCRKATGNLLSAASMDIDYDAISHAVNLNVFWDKGPNSGSWTEKFSLASQGERVEVGVLKHETNPDPEDIAFSGFLTVLGQDSKPKPTQFQTPTRHYPLSASNKLTYRTSFSHPTGLHPTLIISLPQQQLGPPEATCKLHTYVNLPSYLFIDKYAFTDALFLSSQHLTSLRSISGATDLEAPDWVIPEWGSAALFEIATPSDAELEAAKPGNQWNVSIPLHLRYLPAQDGGYAHVPVPWPVVFWACRAEEGNKMAVNPFDRLHLGYEGLFGTKTRFMHVPPVGQGNRTGALVEWIKVPVLDLSQTRWVERGTVGVVIVAFLGLCWVLFRGLRSKDRKSEGGVDKGKKNQ